MAIEIRTERPGDEPALDVLLTRAFDGSAVAGLVGLLRRHWPGYDRGLSVTAWDGGCCVGHVLGLTARVRMAGQTQLAMSIGPVCVDPDYQRQGLGKQLMARTHELGRRAGARFVMLEGVPSYYPQLGYRPCWALADLRLSLDALPADGPPLTATPVAAADLPWLAERLAAELAEVDFGWLWPETLDCWALPGVNAVIWRTVDGRRAAYTLARPNSPFEPPREALVLADDADLAVAALRRLGAVTLAHHPNGWLAREVLDPAWVTHGARPVVPYCLAFELVPGALTEYLTAVESDHRPPALANWPLPFWLC